jgi:hypothetical protein
MLKIDGWENLIQDEIIVDASNPCKNSQLLLLMMLVNMISHMKTMY